MNVRVLQQAETITQPEIHKEEKLTSMTQLARDQAQEPMGQKKPQGPHSPAEGQLHAFCCSRLDCPPTPLTVLATQLRTPLPSLLPPWEVKFEDKAQRDHGHEEDDLPKAEDSAVRGIVLKIK